VLVIGAGGYIGEAVAVAFRRAGFKVYGLLRDEKKAKRLTCSEIIPVIGSQADVPKYQHLLSEVSVIVDAIGMNDFSEKFLEVVIQANSHKAEIYRPLFIFTSGIMTYGNASTGYVTELTVPKPMFPDMEVRRIFEEKVVQTKSINTVVVRPGYVYGGHGGGIADMFFGVKQNEDLVLLGSKDKRWSWVHVDDLGDAYVKIGQKGNTLKGQLFNLSAVDNPNFEELRVAMAKATGWNGKVKFEEVPKGSSVQSWEATVLINPQKAIDLLNWQPRHIGYLNEMDIYYRSWKAGKDL